MAFQSALSLHKFLWATTLLFITSKGPTVFIRRGIVRGQWGCMAAYCGLGFCWRLIWSFSGCRLFQKIWARTQRPRQLFLSLPPLCLTPNWKSLSWVVVRAENRNKWHVTRTQCMDGPAKVSGPICCGRFLFCRLSAASGERGRERGLRCNGGVGQTKQLAWLGEHGPPHSCSSMQPAGPLARAQVICHSSGIWIHGGVVSFALTECKCKSWKSLFMMEGRCDPTSALRWLIKCLSAVTCWSVLSSLSAHTLSCPALCSLLMISTFH